MCQLYDASRGPAVPMVQRYGAQYSHSDPALKISPDHGALSCSHLDSNLAMGSKAS